MRVSSWSLWLVLPAVTGLADPDSRSLRHPQIRLLQDDLADGSGRVVLNATDAPNSHSTPITNAPVPTETPVGGNLTEAPAGNGTITEAPTGDSSLTDAPGDDEVATEAPGGNDTGDLAPVGSPAPSLGFDTEVLLPPPPIYVAPTEYPTPTPPTPTYKAPTYSNSPPTSPTYSFPTPTAVAAPTEEYVPLDDDPIKNEDIAVEEEWADSMTLEQMEKDRNVLIALSTVAGFGFLLMIITAHQMLENPDGCYATICRITVACSCAIFRLVCFPCRMICGCTNKNRNTHELMQNNFSHDLELS